MRVGEIMRTHVETIGPQESTEAAVERMRRARIRRLVVQDGQKIVGMVSDRDIVPGSQRQLQTVEDVMSSPGLDDENDLFTSGQRTPSALASVD